MSALRAVLSDDVRRKALVDELTTLVDNEVGRVSGISGLAIKAGYKVVSALRNGRMVSVAVNALLPSFIGGVEPLLERFSQSGEKQLGAFMVRNEREAVNALLSVTDARATHANAVIQGSYRKLRPLAERQVANALPNVGAVLQRYL